MEKTIEREIEPDILKWLDSEEIIAIRGARQAGKTTLLKRFENILIEKGVNKNRIHFITFEDDIEKEKFERNPKEYIEYFIGEDKEKHFFLLDEVQYIKKAGKLLKLIYDTLENIKIIITGSSSLDLNEIGSFLVGRVLLFELYPFSFFEFLKAKDKRLLDYYSKNRFNISKPKKEIRELIFLEELNKLFREYICYGGYPKVVLEKDLEKKKFLLKNLYLTYVEKDIVKVYGIKYKERIMKLIKTLAAINTGLINYNEISEAIELYDKEVKQLLSILEDTYIIKLIKPYHKNLATELKKNPKVYFIDTGLRNFLAERFDFSEDEFGKLAENYVMRLFVNKKTNFWRTTAKAEVDFIIEPENMLLPIEAKLKPKITRSFRSFINFYNPKIAILANLKKLEKLKIDSTEIFAVPLALL